MTPTLTRLLASILLLGLWALTPLQAAPQAFQASYDVVKSGLTLGEMQANLNYAGNRYTYLKQTKANGLAALLSGDTLTERSAGQKRGAQLLPQTYLQHHKNRRKDRRDQFQFNTPTQVTGNFEGTAYQLNVPNGTLDPALLELRIMDDLAANRPLVYQVTEKGKLKQYRFQRQGQETLKLPAGTYACEKIHMVRDEGKRSTTLWLAPELGYVPVKIRHDEKGDVIETQLKKYQPR
ncbi:MAG: DUF3108 domain-containing protein [Thiolinea sp.]